MTLDLASPAPACFAHCGCSCRTTYDAFDRVAADELREPLRLHDLCRANIGWYTDGSLADTHLRYWGLQGLSSL